MRQKRDQIYIIYKPYIYIYISLENKGQRHFLPSKALQPNRRSHHVNRGINNATSLTGADLMP